MAEIVIKTGAIAGQSNINRLIQQAIVETVGKSVLQARNEHIGKVARKTGRLRTEFAVGTLELAQEAKPGSTRVTLTAEKLMRFITDGGLDYAPYHILEHPDFNYNFAGGYRNPTTGGTKPISVTEVMRSVLRNVRRNITPQLRSKGIDAT